MVVLEALSLRVPLETDVRIIIHLGLIYMLQGMCEISDCYTFPEIFRECEHSLFQSGNVHILLNFQAMFNNH